MWKRFLRWLMLQWKEYQRDVEIQRAAESLGIIDAGWTPIVSVEEGSEYVRTHFACPTRARLGVIRSMSSIVCWCYRCRVTWHPNEDDDDDGPRRKKSPESPPFGPVGDVSPRAQEVYEALMARAKKRDKASV